MTTTDPTRTDPRAVRRRALLLAGLALASFVVALLVVLGARPAFGETSVEVDGRPHGVAVEAGVSSVIWAEEYVVDPTCVVRDAASGTEVGLEVVAPGSRRTRYGGSAGDWAAYAAFTPSTDEVTVACSGGSGVLVTPEPASLPRLGVVYGGAGALVLVGLVLTIQLITEAARRRRGD